MAQIANREYVVGIEESLIGIANQADWWIVECIKQQTDD